MTDLSPATRAVLDAFGTYPLRADHIDEDLVFALAAALKAAAKQSILADIAVNKTIEVVPVDILLAIAAELEARP